MLYEIVMYYIIIKSVQCIEVWMPEQFCFVSKVRSSYYWLKSSWKGCSKSILKPNQTNMTSLNFMCESDISRIFWLIFITNVSVIKANLSARGHILCVSQSVCAFILSYNISIFENVNNINGSIRLLCSYWFLLFNSIWRWSKQNHDIWRELGFS